MRLGRNGRPGWGWAWACLGAFGLARGGDSVRLLGNLQDTAFPPPVPVRLEVLETGDTLNFAAGTPFRLDLPRDTLWNLCFSADRPAAATGPADGSPAAPAP